MSEDKLFLYDTTLRDGTQRQGISLSADDKLKITRLLDSFGIPYIEGGWPGSNPKDINYFEQVRKLDLKQAKIVAFGSTRRANCLVKEDTNLRLLLAAGTPAVAVVGKSWRLHVEKVLRTTRAENLLMISESIKYLKDQGREVIYDAEHFFDGFKADPVFTLETIRAARESGADWIVLCDTNGGSLPFEVSNAVTLIKREIGGAIGIHTHNDAELAVANSLAAVEVGATQIQGTVNGYGERCGNANLVSLIPTLQLKLGRKVVGTDQLEALVDLSRSISEIANLGPDTHAPYVGKNAFAHKGGIHVAAVERVAESYEHINPELVGNSRTIVVSELSGRGNLRMTARNLGIEIAEDNAKLLEQIKSYEERGYQFENADGTIELMLRRTQPSHKPLFKLLDMTVVINEDGKDNFHSQAIVKLEIGNKIFHTVAEGDGPVNAIDQAFRKALQSSYPTVSNVHLTDFKVRIIDPERATDAMTRVHLEAAFGDARWTTVGCGRNIIKASWEALADSIELFLLRQEEAKDKRVLGLVAND